MANKVLLKKSAVLGKIPNTSDLDYGELAINYADGKLYYKTSLNTIESFVAGAGGSSSDTFKNIAVSGQSTVVADSPTDTLTLVGTADLGITTDATTDSITFSLLNTAVTAGSYGSQTQIPIITVDAKGRITAASTATVSSSLPIAGDSGTDTVSLLTDTLTFTGGTGLDSVITNNTVTFNIDSTVATLTGTQTLTNKSLQDSTTYFVDDLDSSKKLQFQLSGITSATTRTLTVQDVSGTIALTSNNLGSFGTTTSAQLASVISDETGSGALVFATSPTLVTPNLGTPASGTLTNCTGLPNSGLVNSTISGVALGSNLNTLTLNVSGTGLSGSTTYNGSAAATFTVTSNATNANTASTIVARDASGNFSAGTITATISGSISGGTVSGSTLTSTVATGTAPLTVTSTTKVANLNVEQVDGYHADTANTASTLVVRDASKNISTSDHIFSGATSGTTTLKASAVASGTITMPANTGTMALVSDIITTSDTAPATPADNRTWVDSANGDLNIFYNDSTSTQWVNASSGMSNFGISNFDGGGASTSIWHIFSIDCGRAL